MMMMSVAGPELASVVGRFSGEGWICQTQSPPARARQQTMTLYYLNMFSSLRQRCCSLDDGGAVLKVRSNQDYWWRALQNACFAYRQNSPAKSRMAPWFTYAVLWRGFDLCCAPGLHGALHVFVFVWRLPGLSSHDHSGQSRRGNLIVGCIQVCLGLPPGVTCVLDAVVCVCGGGQSLRIPGVCCIQVCLWVTPEGYLPVHWMCIIVPSGQSLRYTCWVFDSGVALGVVLLCNSAIFTTESPTFP